jgi:AraC family transcriptional regulator
MADLDVRIVDLPPMRVARVHAFGEHPEHMAGQKLLDWAQPKGLLDDPQAHRIFGFNNPSPSPGSPNYGYEFWITVGPEEEPDGEAQIQEFAGGLYAVARCTVSGDPEAIGRTWQRMVVWREESPYQGAGHQWLEEHMGYFAVSENFTLDCYLPIAQ